MWRSFAIASFLTSGYLLILSRGEGGHWGFGLASVLALGLGAVSWKLHEGRTSRAFETTDSFDATVYPNRHEDPEQRDPPQR